MSPPFNAKEIARYFVWIAILALAIGAILWFAVYAPGRKSIHPTRNGATIPGTV